MGIQYQSAHECTLGRGGGGGGGGYYGLFIVTPRPQARLRECDHLTSSLCRDLYRKGVVKY